MSNYHGRILNVQSIGGGPFGGYYEGHRDARHSAAEIGNEADAEVERLRDLLREALDDFDQNSWLKDHFQEWGDVWDRIRAEVGTADRENER